jgi:hypothetical protein
VQGSYVPQEIVNCRVEVHSRTGKKGRIGHPEQDRQTGHTKLDRKTGQAEQDVYN